MTEPDDQGTDDEPALCLTCLCRPSRPGSLWCSRLCRLMDFGRRLRLFLTDGNLAARRARESGYPPRRG